MEELLAALENPEEVGNLIRARRVQILSDWDYAAGTSDHRRLSSTSIALDRAFHLADTEDARKLAIELIDNHLKVVYRCLGIARPAITGPAFAILTHVARLAPAELYNAFDFTHQALPRLLGTMGELRKFALHWWLAFVRASAPTIRRELMTANRRIWAAWISHVSEDQADFVDEQIAFWKEVILKDPATFSSQTKTQMFNEWALRHLAGLIRRADTAPAAASFFLDLKSTRSLALIRVLKPWESSAQMELVVSLLTQDPTLVEPYFSGLATGYSFNPKASMFWFNFSVLHARVAAISGAAWPATATRQVLQAGLGFNSALVQFQTAQVVLAALRRLRNEPASVAAMIVAELPPPHLFVQPRSPELLQTVCLECAVEFARQGYSDGLVLPAALLSVLDEQVSGLALIRAQATLELEARNGGLAKWWTRSRGAHSLFTKLSKFASANPLLQPQARRLLEFLVDPTLIFCKCDLVSSPVYVLLHTLEYSVPELSPEELEKLWNLLDETISRVARAPFPYIDLFPTEATSPFAAAIAEQLSHVPQPSPRIRSFVVALCRNLIVNGEAPTTYFQGENPDTLSLDSYAEFILRASVSDIKERTDLVFKIETPFEVAATCARISRTPELANHLLASIPADLAHVLAHPVCARKLLGVVHQFVEIMQLNEVGYTAELAAVLESSENWSRAVQYLSTKFLLEHANEGARVVNELTHRGIACLPPPSAVDGGVLAANVKFWPDDAIRYSRALLSSSESVELAVALIERFSWFDADEVRLGAHPLILATASRIIPGSVPYPSECSVCIETIPLFAAFSKCLEPKHEREIDILFESITRVDVNLAQLSASINGKGVDKWLRHATVWLTQQFAQELQSPVRILEEIPVAKLWIVVPGASINALISAAISGKRKDSAVFTCVSRLVAAAPSTGKVDPGHLQELLEQQLTPDSRTAESELIWWLLKMAPAAASQSVQHHVIVRYSGGLSGRDMLLLDALRQLELILKRSWADLVVNWNFSDNSNEAQVSIEHLLVASSHGSRLWVTVEPQRITDTVRNYDPSVRLALPEHPDFDSVHSAINHFDTVLAQPRSYNDDFLLGAIVASCDPEKLDVRRLAESGALGYVICCLGSTQEGVRNSAHQLLTATYTALGREDYKEHVAMRLLVGKTLLYTHQHLRLPAYLATMLAQLQPMASNPASFLHEKVADWLLAGPSIREKDLPLWRAVLSSTAAFKQRELAWLVQYLASACVDAEAVNVYLKHGVFEWTLAQSTPSVKRAADKLVERAADRAPFSLITRAGGLVSSHSGLLAASIPQSRLIEWSLGFKPVNI